MSERKILQKMEIIQSIFREVQESFSEKTKLNNYEIEFRGIAYEAASMNIALIDFKTYNELKDWYKFLDENGTLQATQIHVGLGWAIAQKEIITSTILPNLEPMMRYRVLDGYGYYEGIFRKRKSILSQQKPELKDTTASSAYDQGLGRSIWYLNNGNIDDAKKMIEKFSAERYSDLWRGLGIAITYVGGCGEVALQEILTNAEQYQTQLATGCVMATISRFNAGYIPDDTMIICKLFCNRTAKDLVANFKPISNLLSSNSDSVYQNWISKIEHSF